MNGNHMRPIIKRYPPEEKEREKNRTVLSDDTDLSQLSREDTAATSFGTSWFRYDSIVRRSLKYPGR